MRKKLFIIVIFLTLIAIPATIFLAVQRQELRQRAAPATTLSLSPGSLTKKVGETFSIEVVIDTAENQVVSADIYLTFDPTKLEAQTITNGALFPNILTSGVVESGTASITVGAPSSAAPVKGTGTAAVVRFKALEATTTPASIRFAANTFVGALGEGATSVLIGTTPATITITSTEATPTITPPLTPTATASSSPITIKDDFNSASLDNNLWQTIIEFPESKVSQANGKLQVTTARPGDWITVAGVSTKKEIIGDFQTEVTISNLQVSPISTGSAEIQIYSPEEAGIFLRWAKHIGKSYATLLTLRMPKSEPMTSEPFDLGKISSLRLKLVRTGSTAQGFIDTGKGFQLIATLPNVYPGRGNIRLVGSLSIDSTKDITTSFDNFQATFTPAASPVAELKIISPTTDTTNNQPLIQGKAPAGANVTITIYSTPITIVVTADADGNWSYTPDVSLEPGPHNVVVSAQDPQTGTTLTNATSFVVAGGSGAASQSAIPISGNFTTTLLLFITGLFLIIVGMIMRVL